MRLIVLAAAFCLAGPAAAQTSIYTDFAAPGVCRSAGGASTCAGPAGHGLVIDGNGASDALFVAPPGGDRIAVAPPPGPLYPNGLAAGRLCHLGNAAGSEANARASAMADAAGARGCP
jgi:hypothetical protein